MDHNMVEKTDLVSTRLVRMKTKEIGKLVGVLR